MTFISFAVFVLFSLCFIGLVALLVVVVVVVLLPLEICPSALVVATTATNAGAAADASSLFAWSFESVSVFVIGAVAALLFECVALPLSVLCSTSVAGCYVLGVVPVGCGCGCGVVRS